MEASRIAGSQLGAQMGPQGAQTQAALFLCWTSLAPSWVHRGIRFTLLASLVPSVNPFAAGRWASLCNVVVVLKVWL